MFGSGIMLRRVFGTPSQWNGLVSLSMLQSRNATTKVMIGGVRMMGTENVGSGSMGRTWEDKEHAAEAVYFKKEERELLKKLAKKMHATPEQKAIDSKELSKLFAKHHVQPTPGLIHDIVELIHHH
mmetsp:Transcript_12188/g.20808  ORF Transcript_12188/g.20808 Transcript_12188/m.20808 type:complete len:126 (-) Transcript_12188:291-668(-)|eukprot:CAMPEP_0184693684 /NCGR_PEP_ID=MMETSP0313-20130426/1851_1 /TAXON_ID=2792 /ORGANISM="Porphyridium aerugineum, Strain SAG 1380-2" /LENGTH=125 /DNA_ID=CAMNT_0027151823 /DNA_START=228 /DNA_END=605 /DNA_ORIENTATION=+